jgi:hypothetical protein
MHCADRIMRQFAINQSAVASVMKLTPVLVLQPQGGKYGTGDEVADRFIEDCVSKSRPNDPRFFQIIMLSGLTNLSNKEQAIGRTVDEARLCAKAKLTGLARYPDSREGIRVLNCSQAMHRYDFNDPEVKVRLWILDEAHIANTVGGCISSMLQKHGVYMSRPVSEWGNETGTINLVLLMSATPYAHELKGDKILGLKGDPDYSILYHPPDPEYNSLSIMRESGRFRQTEPLPSRQSGRRFDNTEFFENVVYADFLKLCERLGPGYLVIRASGKRHKQLVDYLKRPGYCKFRTFDADSHNIDDLNTELGRRPNLPEIILIKGSQRAGMTLPRPNFIRGWYENKSVNVDTVAQSGAGRACGYGRLSDEYPIYCHLPHIDEAIAHYVELEQGECHTMPTGAGNKGKRSRSYFPIKEWIYPPNALAKAHAHPDFLKYANLKDKGKGGQGGRKVILSCSRNVRNDYADLLLRGARDSGNPFGYFMDGPTTMLYARKHILDRRGRAGWRPEMEAKIFSFVERNIASWNRFVALHPDKVGCVAVLDDAVIVDAEDDHEDPRNGLQRVHSALKKDGTRPVYRRKAFDPIAATKLVTAWRVALGRGQITSADLQNALRTRARERKYQMLAAAFKDAGIDVSHTVRFGLGLKRLASAGKHGWVLCATGKTSKKKILWGLERRT